MRYIRISQGSVQSGPSTTFPAAKPLNHTPGREFWSASISRFQTTYRQVSGWRKYSPAGSAETDGPSTSAESSRQTMNPG